MSFFFICKRLNSQQPIDSQRRRGRTTLIKLRVPFSGTLVHVLHRPAAKVRVVERVQRGHQVKYVWRHRLPEPDVHDAAHQLQQLQAANEQQGLDLRQVRLARELTSAFAVVFFFQS